MTCGSNRTEIRSTELEDRVVLTNTVNLHRDLQVSYDVIIDECHLFDRAIDQVSQSMEMLGKFEAMPGLRIDLSNKYQQVLKTFAAELQSIAAIYEANKANPDILRNMSPTAGRIAWARQLYERIELPMGAFHKHPQLLKVMQRYRK
jgi:Dynein heavy chain, N-terminal region 1